MKLHAPLLFVALTLAFPAFAQEAGNFSAERLRPAMDREGVLDTESGEVGSHLDYDVAFWVGYALNPLVFYTETDGRLERVASPVGHRLGVNLIGSLALMDWVKIGIDVPAVLFQARGGELVSDLVNLDQLSPVGLGDIRLIPKVGILKESYAQVDLSLLLPLTLPTALPQGQYLGDEFINFHPELALSKHFSAFRVLGNLGYRYRPERQLQDLTVGQELTYRVAAAYNLKEEAEVPVEIGASINGTQPVLTPFQNVNQSPLELMVGGTYDPMDSIGELQVFGGFGIGLVAGHGTPDTRIFAGVRWSPRNQDNDEDGILNSDDGCPNDPEDVDGHMDSDGCPDPDNDEDTVLDADDKCEKEKEDVDGFEDGDGCPDPDNDGDGIPDGDDECPDDAEDMDSFEDGNGCPDPDNDGDTVLDGEDKCPLEAGKPELLGCNIADQDGDGIPDEADKCPAQPEDKDGFQDEDGCPDPDNDQDGIPDADDKCPGDKEDLDLWEDKDGCPDPDNDGDGILDGKDQCPVEPEVINGFKDDDGCPDKGETKVKVTKTKIEILEKVYFATASSRIKKKSHNLLRQVAAILKTNPQITKIRIEGHTDSQGSEASNQKLSDRRAASVKRFLEQQGVAKGRLVSQGFGESKPVDTNDTREGRENNRRVEFNIVEIDGKAIN
jgi:outer membrane protein OmpA-like peptidoglycan-associated protein